MSENEEKTELTLSDNQKLNKRIKTISILLILGVILWVFVLNPLITFKKNEKTFQEAAQRYYEFYESELPTGDRIADVSLQKLYEKGFIDTDFYVPYKILKKTTCSVTDSWVKVAKKDDGYKYYTYLKCGLLSSSVDHKGPRITLNGDKEMTIGLGEEYTEPGVKSVRDNSDGSIDTEKVTIEGKVDTSKIGVYEVTYSAIDTLKNKSTVTRTVTVVQKLNSTIKKATENTGYYIGNPNNYIYFSGVLFRIVDIDGDNVRIVADRDVSNVNYSSLDDWLEYYYDHLSDESKKLVVKNKYCQMTVNENDTTATSCSSYTKTKEVYIPSIVDINRAQSGNLNFLKPTTMSWVADKASDDKAYLTRDVFYGGEYGKSFLAYNQDLNFGIRPMLTIKGDTLIVEGTGTKDDPYNIGEFTRGKADDYVNSRTSGEYISINGAIWRIIEAQKDGTTKVIYNEGLNKNGKVYKIAYGEKAGDLYDVDNSYNIGYKINNESSQFIETKYFVNHEIEVPIYKDKATYNGEEKVKKYKAKIVVPNMYEMYSATPDTLGSYSTWYINSSKNHLLKYGIADKGSSVTEETSSSTLFGVRPVAFLNSKCIIVSGNGTLNDPYVIKK